MIVAILYISKNYEKTIHAFKSLKEVNSKPVIKICNFKKLRLLFYLSWK